jgi:N-acetylmuramoyl-L-alanine amidase
MRALPILIALILAAPDPALAAPRGASQRASPRHPSARKPARRPARAPTLAEAKAAMAALQRDRSRRRFRHHWERAIGGLLRAARGRDAPAAWLEAARARYALFRWSANDADREAALTLAARASRAGSRQAPALAAAIRREAGDDRPAPSRARPAGRKATRGPPPAADDESGSEAEAEEAETPTDPALAAALADLSSGAGEPLRFGASAGEGPARVTEVRSWSSGEYTRVAIYLSHWVGWQKLELPAAPGTPRRLALDFRPAELDRALARPVAGSQVDRVRAAQNDPDTVRVVLDLPGAEGLHLFGLEDPPRLIVDVGSPEPRPSVAAAPPAPPGSEALPLPPPPPSAPGVGEIRRVVVDAGHGGRDPGAIGPGRVREKDVTLAIARKLSRRLREAGFEVVLTREKDRTLALEERTALANTAGADLFVSVHANAHPRRNRVGVETYFLNVANDRYAARLAERENGLDLGDGDAQAARILTDLDAKASASASRRLGALVQREVTGGVRARVGPVRDLGVKSALFYVLLGARMPAVLVEAGFISNREEERRLSSAAYQDEVAAGIARAVVSYARSDARVAAAR